MSTKEAAQAMGVADGTIKAQLARARAKLTKLMRRAHTKTSSVLACAALPTTATE
jgi:DNA-directed RNA polymerase specialized sigma24 family protein